MRSWHLFKHGIGKGRTKALWDRHLDPSRFFRLLLRVQVFGVSSTFRMKEVDSSFLVRLHWSIQNSSCTFNVPMFLYSVSHGAKYQFEKFETNLLPSRPPVLSLKFHPSLSPCRPLGCGTTRSMTFQTTGCIFYHLLALFFAVNREHCGAPCLHRDSEKRFYVWWWHV